MKTNYLKSSLIALVLILFCNQYGFAQAENLILQNKMRESHEVSSSPVQIDTFSYLEIPVFDYRSFQEAYRGPSPDTVGLSKQLADLRKKDTAAANRIRTLTDSVLLLKEVIRKGAHQTLQVKLKSYQPIVSAFDSIVMKWESSNIYLDTASFRGLYTDTLLLRQHLNMLLESERQFIRDFRKNTSGMKKILQQVEVALVIANDRQQRIPDTTLKKLEMMDSLGKNNQAIINQVNGHRENLKKDLEARKKEKEDASKTKTALQDAITAITPTTTAQIIPSLNIKGSAYQTGLGQKSLFAIQNSVALFYSDEVPSFTDSTGTDEVYEKLSHNLWIPEASNFGIRYQFQGLQNIGEDLTKSGAFGFDAQLFYLNKNIPVLSDSGGIVGNQNTSIGHIKLGASITVVKDIFTPYAKLNIIFPIDHIENFNHYFNTELTPSWLFWDIGIESHVQIKPTDNYISLGLGFIMNSPELEKITRVHDLAIPTLKLSLVPDLTPNKK